MSVCLTECNQCPNKSPLQDEKQCPACSNSYDASSSNCQNITFLEECADHLALNCDTSDITEQYPCSNFLNQAISGSRSSQQQQQKRRDENLNQCTKCDSCSTLVLHCTNQMINDIKKTIHDANKTASINNFEYDESFNLTSCTGDLLRDYVCSSVIKYPSPDTSPATRPACHCSRYQRTCPFLRVGNLNTLHGGQSVLQCPSTCICDTDNCYDQTDERNQSSGTISPSSDATKNRLNYLFWLVLVTTSCF